MNQEAISGRSRFPQRHPVWTIAAVALVIVTVVLAVFDWNWVKRPVERIVSGTLEREFRIDGNLDVDFFPLEVHAEKLYLANADWSDEPAMARVEKLDMRVRFWPLLAGRFTLPMLAVEQPVLRLERNREGIGNWNFNADEQPCTKDCGSRMRILQLRAEKGSLAFREPSLRTSIDVQFNSGTATADAALAPLVFDGSGTYRDAAFELAGQVDSPLALRGKASPYQIDVRARAGDTRAHAYGTLAEPLQTRNVTLNFDLEGPDLALLYEFAGVVLPETPPYRLKGTLTRAGDRFSYEDFNGTVGDSDLAGSASVEIGGARPRLTAVLNSRVIDFDDLAGFIGGTPATGDGETASKRQEESAADRRRSGKFLPSTRIKLDRLRAMDADVQLQAGSVESRRLPLESMTAHLKLVDGQMRIDPLDFGAAGGRLSSVVKVDARGEPAKFALEMKIQGLQLPKLMPRVKLMQDSVGSIAGLVRLEGHGDSTAQILASSNGSFSAIMGQGQMSNLLLEVAGLDIAEALAFLIGKDRQVTLRCAYADFDVVDGVATARSVAFDTTDTALLIRGDLKFKDESLNLTLVPRPKDMSPISIRTPIDIGGTFADPSFAPKPGPLLLRGAAVAALAAIAPPLALLGLVERGPGEDTGCGAAPAAPAEPKKPEATPKRTPGPKPNPA